MASLARVSPVPLDKITKAPTEIESCNAYDTPEMKSAKANWLGILTDAINRYESLEDKDFQTINFVLSIHYLNYSQIMFRTEMVGAFAEIGKTFVAIMQNRLKRYKDSTETQIPEQTLIQDEKNDDNDNENETK